jgi:hypothetical protein
MRARDENFFCRHASAKDRDVAIPGAENFFSHKRRESARKRRIVIALVRIGASGDSRGVLAAALGRRFARKFFSAARRVAH